MLVVDGIIQGIVINVQIGGISVSVRIHVAGICRFAHSVPKYQQLIV